MKKNDEEPTARQRRVWDRTAGSYDRQIGFAERHLLAGAREWLGARAQGRVPPGPREWPETDGPVCLVSGAGWVSAQSKTS